MDARSRVEPAWRGYGPEAHALAIQTLFTPSLGVALMPLAIVWLIAANLLTRRTSLCLLADHRRIDCHRRPGDLPIALHYWRVGTAVDRTTVEVALHSASWIDWISAQRHWLYGDALRYHPRHGA